MITALLTIPGYDLNRIEFAGSFVLVLAGSVAVGLFLGWLFDRIIRPLNDVVLTTSVTLVHVPDSLAGHAGRNFGGLCFPCCYRVLRGWINFPFAAAAPIEPERAKPDAVGRNSWDRCHRSGLVAKC